MPLAEKAREVPIGTFSKEIRDYKKYSGLEVGRTDANRCLRQLGERSNQMSFYLSILFLSLSLYPFYCSTITSILTESISYRKLLLLEMVEIEKRKWFQNTCCRDGKTITLDAFYFNKSANGAFTFGNGLALRLNRNISSSIVLYFV